MIASSSNALPGSVIKTDVLKAKVFLCSLEQLMPIKGLRTDLISQTRTRRYERVKSDTAPSKAMESYQVQRANGIRGFPMRTSWALELLELRLLLKARY